MKLIAHWPTPTNKQAKMLACHPVTAMPSSLDSTEAWADEMFRRKPAGRYMWLNWFGNSIRDNAANIDWKLTVDEGGIPDGNIEPDRAVMRRFSANLSARGVKDVKMVCEQEWTPYGFIDQTRSAVRPEWYMDDALLRICEPLAGQATLHISGGHWGTSLTGLTTLHGTIVPRIGPTAPQHYFDINGGHAWAKFVQNVNTMRASQSGWCLVKDPAHPTEIGTTQWHYSMLFLALLCSTPTPSQATVVKWTDGPDGAGTHETLDGCRMLQAAVKDAVSTFKGFGSPRDVRPIPWDAECVEVGPVTVTKTMFMSSIRRAA